MGAAVGEANESALGFGEKIRKIPAKPGFVGRISAIEIADSAGRAFAESAS